MLDPLSGIFAFIGLITAEKIGLHNAKKDAPKMTTPSHPEPHKDPETGKIIIENNKLYYEDIDKYGASQAQKWVKEGRYNLTPEEFEKEKERIRQKYRDLHK